MEVPWAKLGHPANLSQVGEQVWYEQMDMGGGGRGGGESYSFLRKLWSRFRLLSVSLLTNVYSLVRWDEMFLRLKIFVLDLVSRDYRWSWKRTNIDF